MRILLLSLLLLAGCSDPDPVYMQKLHDQMLFDLGDSACITGTDAKVLILRIIKPTHGSLSDEYYAGEYKVMFPNGMERLVEVKYLKRCE